MEIQVRTMSDVPALHKLNVGLLEISSKAMDYDTLSSFKNDLMMLVLGKDHVFVEYRRALKAHQESMGSVSKPAFPTELVKKTEVEVNALLRAHFPDGKWFSDPALKPLVKE